MRELLFADDSALVAHSAEDIQKIVDAFIDVREEDIMVDGNKLNSVLEFTYIGSTISSNGCIDDEIQRRLHLSADNARDSRATTMHPYGLKTRYTVQSCCPPSYMEPKPGQCTDDS